MRLAGRIIPRETVLRAVESLELVEAYPDDEYLALEPLRWRLRRVLEQEGVPLDVYRPAHALVAR